MKPDSIQTEKPPDKQAAILDAALTLFSERGFHGTAVPRIAEQAGVAAGTIYRHFENKEALVNAVYRTCKTNLVEALLTDFPWSEEPRAQFHVFWRRMVDFARGQPQAFSFLELHHHAPYLDETSRALERESLQPVLAFFEASSTAGLTKPAPPEALIAIVWGAFAGLVKAHRLGHLELDEAVIDQGEASCWDAVRRME